MNGLKRQINTVYYDIHAHSAQTSVAEDVVACYNVIVGKGTLQMYLPATCILRYPSVVYSGGGGGRATGAGSGNSL